MKAEVMVQVAQQGVAHTNHVAQQTIQEGNAQAN